MYEAMMTGEYLLLEAEKPTSTRSLSAGYITNDLPDKAIDLFAQVEQPNEGLIELLFNACGQSKRRTAPDLVKTVSSTMPQSSCSNARLVTSLLGALMNHGDMKRARSIFDASKTRDVPMYAAMMQGKSVSSV